MALPQMSRSRSHVISLTMRAGDRPRQAPRSKPEMSSGIGGSDTLKIRQKSLASESLAGRIEEIKTFVSWKVPSPVIRWKKIVTMAWQQCSEVSSGRPLR